MYEMLLGQDSTVTVPKVRKEYRRSYLTNCLPRIYVTLTDWLTK